MKLFKKTTYKNKITIQYKIGRDNLKRGLVSLSLVCDKNKEIPQLLRTIRGFGGYEINAGWGRIIETDKIRMKYEVIEGNSWQEIKDKAHKRKDEVIQMMKEVYQENKKLLTEEIPEDEEFELIFED